MNIRRTIKEMAIVIAVILSMTGCGASKSQEPEATAEPTVEPTVEPEEQKVYVRFYNENGDSNGEIYEISIFENIEDALDHKSEINVGVENYPKMLFGETEWEIQRARDPFTGNPLRMDIEGMGERSVVPELTFIRGKYVSLTFARRYGEYRYAVVKIQ